MRIVGLPAVFYKLAKQRPQDMTETAHQRLRLVMAWDALQAHGVGSAEAAQTIGVSRATLYRWRRRLSRQGPRGLELRSRAPHRLRHPTWNAALVQAVLDLRERFPRWGKDRLTVLLRRLGGWQVSVSMVGRILALLRRRGLLHPPLARISARKRRAPRPYAQRKPKDYVPRQPGDLVQVDTLDVRPVPGVILKQFTARDVVAKWDVVELFSRATASTATRFLDQVQARMPFPIRAIQIDGGSEFQGTFEQACLARGLRLFVLPPRSPKLNGCVERAQRTHTEEFYETYDGDLDLASANQALRRWEAIYNTFRPHQALGWITPLEYLQQHHPRLAPHAALSHMW